jgi:hypothetical protein
MVVTVAAVIVPAVFVAVPRVPAWKSRIAIAEVVPSRMVAMTANRLPMAGIVVRVALTFSVVPLSCVTKNCRSVLLALISMDRTPEVDWLCE